MQRYTRDYLHSLLIDFDPEDFIQKYLAPLEKLCFSPDLSEDFRFEGLYNLIYFYFIFDKFSNISELSHKITSLIAPFLQKTPINPRILFNKDKFLSMLSISHKFKEEPLLIEPKSQLILEEESQENDAEIEISYGNFSFAESQEIFHLEKNLEFSSDNSQILAINRLKTANHLLFEGFISEDYEILRKSNEEFEFLIKENSDKGIEETQLLSDSYIGLLILNLFKSKSSALKLSDLLESFSLVIELHGVPRWEKFILLLHSCEKIIREQERKTGICEEKAIEIEEDERLLKYSEVLTGFKKIMGTVFMKLKKFQKEDKDNSFNNKFLLDLFKEYLKPIDGNEIHSDLIISMSICYTYLEIKVAIIEKIAGKGINNLRNYLFSLWNFLKILKNNRKYEIIRSFFLCITTHETLKFLKAILFYFLISFKHFYQNMQELEIKESQNIFTFNPMVSITFEENEEFKLMNNLLKGDSKNRLKFDDYEEDKAIILHYFKLIFKHEKTVERLIAIKTEKDGGDEVQAFTRLKKALVEKIKLYFLSFEYRKSLRYS